MVKKTIQAGKLQEVDNEAIAELNMDEENVQRREDAKLAQKNESEAAASITERDGDCPMETRVWLRGIDGAVQTFPGHGLVLA